MTGKEIKRIRLRLGLTQKKFAPLIGLKSYHWLSKLENGKAQISGHTEIICKHLRESLVDKVDDKH